MHNIGYCGKGYDVVHGNPQCDKDGGGCVAGFDPRWANTQQVIAMIYTNDTTADGRFLVPQGFELEREVACLLVSSTNSVHDAYNYQTSLGVHASVTAQASFIASVKFSASADYQRRTRCCT